MDAETTANLTNLAIKGIIGVKAMAEIARAVGQDADGTQYDVSSGLQRGCALENRLTDGIRTAEPSFCPLQHVVIARDVVWWLALARELQRPAVVVVDVQPVRR